MRLRTLTFAAAIALGACAQGARPPSDAPKPEVAAAIAAYNRGDLEVAFRTLRAQADRGDSDAQVNLGYLYARGDAVAQNQAESQHLYELSAAQGNGEGMSALGYKYEFGSGVTPDLQIAVGWFCRAIAHGNPRAMNNLAVLHVDGKGVPQDFAEARSLYLQAAERGNVNAMHNLGLYYLGGQGTPVDRAQAIAWLTRAAERGMVPAQKKLATLGVEKPWPPPVDYQRVMELQPRHAPPGRAVACAAYGS
jgi:TPR repeat protein